MSWSSFLLPFIEQQALYTSMKIPYTGLGYGFCHQRPTNGSYMGVRYPCWFYTYYYTLQSARSNHPGGVNVALGDGSVRFVSETISRSVWRPLGTAQDGLSVSFP